MPYLSGNRLSVFIERLFQMTRDRHPGASKKYSDDQLRKSIYKLTKDAERFGIKSEKSCASLLEFSILFGFDFYMKPEFKWAHDILSSVDISQEAKIRRLTS